MLVPLHQLVLKPNMPAGMDLAVIGLWTARLRKSAEPCDPPITVRLLDCGHYLVLDGRHRTVGATVAGRTHIDATEET